VRLGCIPLLISGLVLCAGCPNRGKDKKPPSGADQCLSCHFGIEDIHAVAFTNGQCVVCHGGDATALSKKAAHVAIPSDYWSIRGEALPPAPDGYIKDLAPDQLDQLDRDYLRFINPGDIRVAQDSCGSCHAKQVETVKNSIMTTNAGHYMPTRYLGGFQDQEAIYGSYAASDPDCTGEPGTSCELIPLIPPSDETIEAAILAEDWDKLEEIAYDHYLAKSCDTCHAAGYGKNDSPHLYRSTGCTSCHVLYNKNGVYEGEDPMIPNNVPVFPARHEITTKIPTEQCATCHFQGGRIGLNFRGIRESGFGDTSPNAVPWNESAYGHAAGYYILDEDGTNDVDETPPDIHYSAGMHCADCHVGTDVHGDGRLHATAKTQVDIRCEDCHGTPRNKIITDASGLYRTRNGRVLPQLSTDQDGEVVLTGIVDGAIHKTPQIAVLLSEGGGASEAMHRAMAPNEDDWTHADSLTCDTCHTSYNLYCLGCHVSMDMRLSQIDHQTGTKSTGLVRGSREYWSIDHVLIGQGVDGRAQSVIPSQQVQMTLIDREGQALVGDKYEDNSTLGVFRATEGSNANIGFAPFFQHTTTDKPRTCDVCHRADSSAQELARIKGVYGYGTGEYMLENPAGQPIDALQFIDEDGNQLTEWAHPNTGPLAPEVRDRALGVILSELENE
jgi:hypothetical protein